jgi:alpha-glucosidase (family GH31 glycosyl hydrolase)
VVRVEPSGRQSSGYEGRAHGVFYDHPGRVELDLAKTDPRAAPLTPSDDLVIHVIDGPTPGDVLERDTALTGRTGLVSAPSRISRARQ